MKRSGFVQAGVDPPAQLLFHMNIVLFCGYVSNWKFYLCSLACFKQYSQLVIFSEMHKTTVCVTLLYNAATAMQFNPSQQKCSLLQAIPKHASIILNVHNMLRQII